jgi:predicted phage terminase large subunit-like protein
MNLATSSAQRSLSRVTLPQNRLQAIQWYVKVLTAAAAKSPQHLHQAKRWLARNDLFFLLTTICRRKDLNHDWLFARCREVGANPDGFLDLWAREHYKSTIITFGLSLQDVLASHGEDPEARYNGREVTIGILSHNRPIAKGFLRHIKLECETNVGLQQLFPDVLWDNVRDAPKWAEDEGLIFRRKANSNVATIEAWGLVDGQPTSKHFIKRVYDDVVTDKSVTPEMIPKTTQAWELSDNLGTEGGSFRAAGTRYALFDTYATMIERQIPTRIYPCTSDGSEDFSRSVLRSPEFLAEKRRLQGPYTFGAQMLLNPRADKVQGFLEPWLKYWPATNVTDLNLYIIVDPGGSKKRPDNDYTSMWVVGVGGDENYYIVDGVRDRLRLTERAKWLFRLHKKWRPKGTGYEEYGMQADIEHMESEMDRHNYRFAITPLGGSLSKSDRIKRLVPLFEQGRVFLPHSGIVHQNHEGHQVNIIRQFVQEEYLAFPACAHDDGLDCLARILDEGLGIIFPEPDEHETPKWMRDFQDDELGGSDDWLTQ